MNWKKSDNLACVLISCWKMPAFGTKQALRRLYSSFNRCYGNYLVHCCPSATIINCSSGCILIGGGGGGASEIIAYLNASEN